MVQIIVFIPEDHKESVKEAMFNAGAGSLGNYDHCCFEHTGLGQFRPLANSNAFIGTIGKVERVSEVRVEMCCEEKNLPKVIEAMKEAHPYETPAYYSTQTLNI